jgi:hypothetical protein
MILDLIGDFLRADWRFAAKSKHFELNSAPQNLISEIVYPELSGQVLIS